MTTSTERLANYRDRRDKFFREHENSPLTGAQRESFNGLTYFDEHPDLNLKLEIDDTGDGVGETIQVGTLNGEVKEYTRAGRIAFDADGEPVTLSVFKDVARGRWFLPFRDGTAGEETYAVGRYLDPKARPDGRLVVDFNLAYNPYCAYNTGWPCPIPPFENITKTPIRAGERISDLPGYDTTDS
ncbi:DUF1684 domain-containing protein [soil metagenome]